jgi:putative flippase GtrA
MRSWRRGLNIVLGIASRHHTKIRFLIAGALNTTVGLSVYPIIYYFATPFGTHYLIIFVISQVLCITFSFVTNKFLVFQTSGNYLQEFAKFLTFHFLYFLANLAALPALVELAGMNPVWAQTLFAFLVIVTSYFWHSRYTFTSLKVLH